MTDEISVGEGMVGQKQPREMELVMTAFLPNLKHLESRFDRTDLNIKDLSIGVKDTNNRLIALEKRMDYFEVQVDKRFEQVDKRFEQVDKRFEQVDKRFDLLTGELKDFKGDVNRRFEQVDKRFEQVDKRFDQLTGELKDFKGDVSRRFEQIAASIEQLGDKLDARDAHGSVHLPCDVRNRDQHIVFRGIGCIGQVIWHRINRTFRANKAAMQRRIKT